MSMDVYVQDALLRQEKAEMEARAARYHLLSSGTSPRGPGRFRTRLARVVGARSPRPRPALEPAARP